MTDFGDYVQIMATERCNLACVHCAVPEEDSPAEVELDGATWGEFIRTLGQSGVRSITLSGGEITLREDTPELLEIAASSVERVTLLTNGLIRTSMILRIKAVQERFPNIGIHISLDGASPESHDLVRGRGTFAATTRRIETMRELGLAVTGIHTVLHRANIGEFDDLVELVRSIGAEVWTIFPVASLGRARGGDLRSISPQEWAEVTERAQQLRQIGLDIGQMGPVIGDDWPLDPSRQPRGRSDLSLNLVVGPDGAIFTCPPLRDHELGRVRDGYSPADWQGALEAGAALTRQVCEDCKFRLLCTGMHPTDPYRQMTTESIAEPGELLARLISTSTKG